MPRRWIWWALAAAGAVLIGAIWAGIDNPAFRAAFSAWLDRNDKALNLMATGVMAAFTVTLWWTTHRMWQVSQRDFIATHRPRIRVRFIRFAGVDTEDRQVALVRIANVGQTEAVITGIANDIASRRPAGEWFDAPDEGIRPHGPLSLQSGEGTNLSVSAPPLSDWELFHEAAGHLERWIVGTIRYRDGNGVQRETHFRQRYDAANNRFIPSPDEEYED
jgi:hypothetical protein